MLRVTEMNGLDGRMSKMKPLVPCSSWFTFSNSLGDADPSYLNMDVYVRTQEFGQLVLARFERYIFVFGTFTWQFGFNFYSSRSRANFQANRQSSDKNAADKGGI